MTHPFHPLAGKDVEWVAQRVHRGEFYLELAAAYGVIRRIPARWTSVMDEDPIVSSGGGRTYLRADDLLALTEIVAGLGG